MTTSLRQSKGLSQLGLAYVVLVRGCFDTRESDTGQI